MQNFYSAYTSHNQKNSLEEYIERNIRIICERYKNNCQKFQRGMKMPNAKGAIPSQHEVTVDVPEVILPREQVSRG